MKNVKFLRYIFVVLYQGCIILFNIFLCLLVVILEDVWNRFKNSISNVNVDIDNGIFNDSLIKELIILGFLMFF